MLRITKDVRNTRTTTSLAEFVLGQFLGFLYLELWNKNKLGFTFSSLGDCQNYQVKVKS